MSRPPAAAGAAVEAVTLLPVPGLPEVVEGADLAGLIVEAMHRQQLHLRDGDVVVVSSKVVAKAAGLRSCVATKAVAVLEESRRVVAERRTPTGITRIVAAVAGPVLAAAGIDASNTGPEGGVLRLPRDPDRQAALLRAGLMAAAARSGPAVTALGVIVSDTAGRPWRVGQTDFALGAAGVLVLDDLAGTVDDDGAELRVTARAVADELAGAADLVKGKTSRVPAVVVRGLSRCVLPGEPDAVERSADEGASRLIRAGSSDWFAVGHIEAIRAGLGVPPGSPAAVAVGIPSVEAEPLEHRLRRACALATHPDGLPRVPAGHPRHHVVRSRLHPEQVGAEVVQSGVLLTADEPVTLGVVIGRLLVALHAEQVPAAVARVDPPPADRPRGRYSALLVLV